MGPYEVQDQELVVLQLQFEATRIVGDPLTVRVLRSNVPRGWFDPEMVWTSPPGGKRGRQQQFSDAAIQTCLTLKVLFGMPLRQTTAFVQSLLRLVGLDWVAPDFSTLCRRQQTLNGGYRTAVPKGH